jgi:DNA-binding IclR family transcriptional regulator
MVGIVRSVSTSATEEAAAGGSLTLRRGLRLLHVLAEHPDGLSISQLAAALDTHRAGVYRLLAPLLDERFVQRLADGRHRLGIGLVELSSRVAPRLQEAVLPELRRLADELGATAAMTVRDGEEAVVMAVVEPRNSRMHLAYRAGIRHSVERGASGIAILAAGPPRPGERPEVTEARARGFVRTKGEILAGATGIAVALQAGEAFGEASISLVWIEPRDEESVVRGLLDTRERIVASLG